MSGPAYSGGVTDHHSLLCVFMSCPGPHALSVYPSPVTLSEPPSGGGGWEARRGSRRLPLNAPAPTPAPPRELGRGDAARPEPAAPRRADAPYSAAEQCGRQRPRWSRRSRHVTVINARVTSPRSPSVTSPRSRQSRHRALRESRHVARGRPACLPHEASSGGVRVRARGRPVCLAGSRSPGVPGCPAQASAPGRVLPPHGYPAPPPLARKRSRAALHTRRRRTPRRSLVTALMAGGGHLVRRCPILRAPDPPPRPSRLHGLAGCRPCGPVRLRRRAQPAVPAGPVGNTGAAQG